MNKQLLQELKEKLEKEKVALEEQLRGFADKDPNTKGDWDSKFPKFDGEFGGAALESAADEVEEYGSRLSVEHSMELKLKDIDAALEKIAKGNYGKCDDCNKEMDEKRLMANPAARLCMSCQK